MNANALASPPAAEVRATLRQFILQNFYVADPARLSDEASLLDSGIIDSTGVLELVGFLEHELGLTVADEELVPENLDSLSRLVAFVDRKRGG
jgi:acyl carrier protein